MKNNGSKIEYKRHQITITGDNDSFDVIVKSKSDVTISFTYLGSYFDAIIEAKKVLDTLHYNEVA